MVDVSCVVCPFRPHESWWSHIHMPAQQSLPNLCTQAPSACQINLTRRLLLTRARTDATPFDLLSLSGVCALRHYLRPCVRTCLRFGDVVANLQMARVAACAALRDMRLRSCRMSVKFFCAIPACGAPMSRWRVDRESKHMRIRELRAERGRERERETMPEKESVLGHRRLHRDM